MKEIKLKQIKPRMNYVIVTADRYTADECASMNGGIIRADMINVLKPYQKVISVSDQAEKEGMKPGDLVSINLDRYGSVMQKKDSLKQSIDEYYNANIQYNVPTLELNDEEVLMLGTNDIKFVIEEYVEVEIEKSTIIQPEKKIIKRNNVILT